MQRERACALPFLTAPAQVFAVVFETNIFNKDYRPVGIQRNTGGNLNSERRLLKFAADDIIIAAVSFLSAVLFPNRPDNFPKGFLLFRDSENAGNHGKKIFFTKAFTSPGKDILLGEPLGRYQRHTAAKIPNNAVIGLVSAENAFETGIILRNDIFFVKGIDHGIFCFGKIAENLFRNFLKPFHPGNGDIGRIFRVARIGLIP